MSDCETDGRRAVSRGRGDEDLGGRSSHVLFSRSRGKSARFREIILLSYCYYYHIVVHARVGTAGFFFFYLCDTVVVTDPRPINHRIG